MNGSSTVLRGSVRIPGSKPHTQRALLMAGLADGETTIRRAGMCSESVLMQEAAVELGVRFRTDGDDLIVTGIAGKPRRPMSVMQVRGSGFNLRHLLPVAALAEAPCVLTGDRKLAGRPVQPLLDALGTLGCRVQPVDDSLVLPVITWTTGIAGGTVDVPASETSQFVSALMLAAPYADADIHIRVPEPMVGRHYIRVTLDMMSHFGADVSASADLRAIHVRPTGYRARDVLIGPDVTALFYFIAAAVVVDTDIRVEDVTLGEDGFLDSAVALGRRLGVHMEQEGGALRIRSGQAPAERVEVDASDIPTLVPALAAVASSLPGGMLLRNARHVRHHKTSRLQVVLDELARMGRVLRPNHHKGQLDGFQTDRVEETSVEQVDGQGDHRNFMALSLAAMALDRPVHVLGAETLATSFADFQQCFRSLSAVPTGI